MLSKLRHVLTALATIVLVSAPALAEDDITKIARVETDTITFKDVQIPFPADMLDGWGTDGEGMASVDITAKLMVYTLWGEPVVYCTATWGFNKAQTDNTLVTNIRGHAGNLPREAVDKIVLYDVKLNFFTSLTDNIWVTCDPGYFSKSDDPKLAFTMPESPDWGELFQDNGYDMGDRAERARSHYRELLKSGKISASLPHSVQTAQIDLHGVRKWLAEQDLKVVQQEQQQSAERSAERAAAATKAHNDDKPLNSSPENIDAYLGYMFESAYRDHRVGEVQARVNAYIPANRTLMAKADYLHKRIGQCMTFAIPSSHEEAPNSLVGYRDCLPSPLDALVMYSVGEDDDYRCGYKNKDGKVVLEAQYKSCYDELKGIGVVKRFEGTREETGSTIGLCSGKCSGGASTRYTMLVDVVKWVVINAKGEVLVHEDDTEPVFGFQATYFRLRDGNLVVTRRDEDTYQDLIYDNRLKLRLKLPEGWEYEGYSEDLILIKSREEVEDGYSSAYEYGYVGWDGKFAFDPMPAKEAKLFENGTAWIVDPDGTGFMYDKKGHIVR
jgi:hypothetical protein